MKRSIITIAGISLLTLGLTGCVSGLQGSTYSRSEARQVQEVEFGTVLNTNPVVIEGRQSEAGTVTGSNHRWRCWLIRGTRKRSGNLHNSGRCWRRCGWQYDRRASHSSARSRTHDPNGLRKNTVYCSRSRFRQRFRQRTTCPGTHARCTGSRLTRIAGLMRAADRGIQIENPDRAHAWDTPVGL